ncbi:hypothetical protein M8818_007638 [Zalaria obscura]|uniref:Uncharacterized protein n=1 Tax=Zalaria obscura TaxID=2024903 RepID=A0ACC3S358_9PEZI
MSRCDEDMPPVVYHVYAQSTGTWQYVLADHTTSHCIVLDPVRDRSSADEAGVSTSAADAIITLVKECGYLVDYILETHANRPQCLSAAWYLWMQFSYSQGWPPELCDEATVSGLQATWQRRYPAGSAFSTTIRSGLYDGGTVAFGRLFLTCMRMPG